MKRREFLTLPLQSLGGSLLYTLAGEPVVLQAQDADVAIYIDRQLAGPYGRDKHRYTKPPFVESFPEHGNQGKETPREIYRAGLAQLMGFAGLSPELPG